MWNTALITVVTAAILLLNSPAPPIVSRLLKPGSREAEIADRNGKAIVGLSMAPKCEPSEHAGRRPDIQ